MIANAELFPCIECGVGMVSPKAAPGRFRRLFRGIDVSIPADYPLMTCDTCGETYMNADQSEALDRVMVDMLRLAIDEFAQRVREAQE